MGPADVAHDEWIGQVQEFSSEVAEEDWKQPRTLWRLFKQSGDDKAFLGNLSGHLNKALPDVQKETISTFVAIAVYVYLTDFGVQKCGAMLTLKSASVLKKN